MKWLTQQLALAQITRISNSQAIALFVFLAVAIFLIVQEALNVLGLSIACSIAAVGFALEMILVRARAASRKIARLWPIVLDSLESAAVSGLSLVEALRDLAETAPDLLQPHFIDCVERLDAGVELVAALEALKHRLADQNSDLTIEILRLVSQSGGHGLVESLRSQSAGMRADQAVAGEVAAKQGWIAGTAKLALIAPWLIVALLSFRPENAEIYGSTQGTALLLGGLLMSMIAYRFILNFGQIARQPRVFA